MSPQRQATPVSPQLSDGHSHATPVGADCIGGEKQMTMAEPDVVQGHVIRDGPHANMFSPWRILWSGLTLMLSRGK